jgi:hypothetical protein
MNKKSRLRKKANQTGDLPIGLIMYSPEEKVDYKDGLSGITYGPSISREWEFEKPKDNMEWYLQSND